MKNLWKKIPKKWRVEIVSGAHTVAAAMIFQLLLSIEVNGDMLPTEKQALISLGLAVVRAGWKALAALIASKAKATT